MLLKEKLSLYIYQNLEKVDFLENECCYSEVLKESDITFKRAACNIKDFVEQNKDENKFTTLLFKFIDRTNLKDSDIYNKAGIDRRLFSKIRSNYDYHPKKETVIALSLALELSLDETEELLESASYSLPKNNVFDLIIRFCVIEKIYDLFEVNTLLSEYNCPLLGNIEK